MVEYKDGQFIVRNNSGFCCTHNVKEVQEMIHVLKEEHNLVSVEVTLDEQAVVIRNRMTNDELVLSLCGAMDLRDELVAKLSKAADVDEIN